MPPDEKPDKKERPFPFPKNWPGQDSDAPDAEGDSRVEFHSASFSRSQTFGRHSGPRVEERYVFNGREYASFEDLPPEARPFFRDEDGNGIPDAVDDMMKRFDIPTDLDAEGRPEILVDDRREDETSADSWRRAEAVEGDVRVDVMRDERWRPGSEEAPTASARWERREMARRAKPGTDTIRIVNLLLLAVIAVLGAFYLFLR